MAVNEDYLAYIQDQLTDFGSFEVKKMFGGIGLFKEGLMFGMIAGDTFRLKVDSHNKGDFEKHGMKPYMNKSKKKGMPYWDVPPAILEDRKLLAEWALRSYEAAMRAKK